MGGGRRGRGRFKVEVEPGHACPVWKARHGDFGRGSRPELRGATGMAEPTGGVGLSAGETGEAGLEKARAVGTGIVSPTSGPGVLCCPLSGEASEGWCR
jgi:hypothetical protein